VFDDRGRLVSVRDGTWILALGQHGWVGLISLLGLLTMPILLLARRSLRSPLTAATSGLCVVLAANLIDLVPNSGLTPITWMMAGALIGHLEVLRARAGQTVGEPAAPAFPADAPGAVTGGPAGPVYARDAAPLVEVRGSARARAAREPAAVGHEIEKLPLAARLRARAVRNRGDHGQTAADPAGAFAAEEGAASQPRYTRFAGPAPRGTGV
jgi:hypothetical protein